MADDDNVLGFLCGNERLVTIIDDEEVVLKLSSTSSTKSIADAELIIYVGDRKIKEECRLVMLNVEQLYSNRFYPRTYYYIFRVQLHPRLNEKLNENFEDLGYILQQTNGTTGYTAFYPCSSYWECRKKIAELEDLD